MARIDTLLRDAADRIGGDSPRLDAEILLAHVLGKPRSHLYAWPERELDANQCDAFARLIERRVAGEPVAYLVGEQEFWSLPLTVTPAVLIPRPETERLVELALTLHLEPVADVLDLGTGSGAIAIALATERPGWRLLATDVSEAALDVARINAERHRCRNLDFAQGNWYDAVPATRRFDLIVSNPPYVRSDDPHLQQGDVRFEPEGALTSGRGGLDDIRRIVAGAREHLRPGGWLLVEHGYDQAVEAGEIFREAGLSEVRCEPDLGDRDRVTLGRRSPDDRE